MTTMPLPELPAAGRADRHQLARTVLGEVAETARAEAQAQGYATGWAQGRREAAAAAAAAAEQAEQHRRAEEARREGEHRAAVAALHDAAQQLRGRLDELADAVRAQGTELAWELTTTLLGHELRSVTGPDVVRRVLAAVPLAAEVTVRLHPDVAGDPAVQELAGLRVLPDDSLDRADALVEADGAVTDLRIATAMIRLREVLA